MGVGPTASVLGSSRTDGVVIAVVGTAFATLPPAPPKAPGSRGAESRDDDDSREARDPGRSGDDE